MNGKSVNLLPEDGAVEEQDEKLKDILASNSTLWLHFNGS